MNRLRISEAGRRWQTHALADPGIAAEGSRDAEEMEREQLQKELEESEKWYREIFENAKDAIYVHDLNGRYTLVNKAAESLIGYTRDEILQLSIFDVVAPQHFEVLRKQLVQKLADELPTTYEVEAIRKDGRRVPVEISSRLIYQNGRPVGVQGTARDVSERKRSERALRESEERFRELVENANDIIFTCDMAGNLTSLNRAGQTVSGYSAPEALKMNFAQVVAPGDLAKAGDMLSRKRLADVATVYELEIVTKSGSHAVVEVSSRAIVKDGEPIGVQGIARDITDRKRIEEDLRSSQAQLQQSQKLEAIGQLAGGVAHDFNNLLTAIIGYSDLSLRKLPGESVRRDIEEIMKAARRAASLTRQLLAFSRKQILEPEVLDLNHTVRDMLQMLRRLIGEDIELVTNLTDDLGSVTADPGQIEQIIMNLMVNARDAIPLGGSVIIETANADLDDQYVEEHLPTKAGEYVMLAVSDTGEGMDAETQARIFEPFFTTKEVGKGTGLGLSTVYGIVKQSGGFIWVYSELNVGTTFKIYLPRLADGRSSAKSASVYEPAVLRTGTVLLVEDDVLVRSVAVKSLELAGYKVLAAESGTEALAVARTYHGQIDLLITDVVMPTLGGRELAARLTSMRPNTRVLFMSGYTDDAVVRHRIIDRDFEFLQKPFTPELLIRRVGQVLQADCQRSTHETG